MSTPLIASIAIAPVDAVTADASGVQLGVLSLQGAFLEHCQLLRACSGVAGVREVRTAAELQGLDGLVLPGGESTAIVLIAEPSQPVGSTEQQGGMLEALRGWVRSGRATWGTCAGLILLSDRIEQTTSKSGGQTLVGGLDVTVSRNYFGRQLGSFEVRLPMPAVGDEPFPCVFIRAPALVAVGPGVEVLCSLEAHMAPPGSTCTEPAVAVRQGALLGTAFHPELTTDVRLHQLFVDMARERSH